jgi:arylsulfatase A-like enzyme
MGKWGLGPVGSSGDPNDHGFDLFVGYNCQAVAHSFYAGYIWRNDQQIEINPRPISGHQKRPQGEVTLDSYIGQTYAPHVMIESAEKFIEDHQQQPFVLYLPFIEPHVAMHPPRESVEKFPEEWDSQVYRGESGYLPHPRPRAAYAAMINDLDGYVGRIRAKLKSYGLEQNTLIVFTSDNGTTHEGNGASHFHVGGCDALFFNSTAGLRGYKGSLYEGGIRVPMIVSYPGVVPENEINDTPTHFADWFPTLCAAADLEFPADLDGENLWPLLTAKDELKSRKPMVWVSTEYGGQVAVRIGDHKIIRQNILRPKQPSRWAVYNIREDRNEVRDLAAQFPELIQQTVDLLRAEVNTNPIFPIAIPGIEPRELNGE